MSPSVCRRFSCLAVAGTVFALAACGSDDASPGTTAAATGTMPARTAPTVGTTPAPTSTAAAPAPHRPRAPRCPADASNCKAGSGRVIALESVDADGDGDLHLILASEQSITLPGVTVLDINKDLRPRHDPRVGDWAAGAGPVYQGSYGQSQIQVEHVVYAPRR